MRMAPFVFQVLLGWPVQLVEQLPVRLAVELAVPECPCDRWGKFVGVGTTTLKHHHRHRNKLDENIQNELGLVVPYRRQLTWKMWLQGSFLQLLVMFSRQIMQMSFEASSSSVAFGYKLFMLRMARRDRMTSLNAFLKVLSVYMKNVH